MARYFETFYRHRALYATPIVVAMLFSIGFALLQPATYQSQARIWYDLNGAIGDNTTSNNTFNQYVTPAERQAQVLNELINARAFTTKVAHRSELAQYVATPDGYAQAAGGVAGGKAALKEFLGSKQQVSPDQIDELSYALVTKNTSAFAVGPQMVLVTVSLGNGDVAKSTLQGVVDQYMDEVLGDRRTKAQSAVSFWEQQADTTKSDVRQSDEAVAQYLSQHPQQALPNAVPDSTLSLLRHTYDQNQQRYASLLDKVDQAKLDLAAATPAATGFRVLDQPRSVAPATGLKRQLTLGIGGLVVGVLISLAGVVGMTLLDSTFRRRDEIQSILGLRVIGTIPRVEPTQEEWSPVQRRAVRGIIDRSRTTARPGRTA